jgi:nucleoside-diphosphate-sugar epimerase
MDAGQAFVHREDLLEAFRLTIDRRSRLPQETAILIGESDAVSTGELQDRIGRLVHGEKEWLT